MLKPTASEEIESWFIAWQDGLKDALVALDGQAEPRVVRQIAADGAQLRCHRIEDARHFERLVSKLHIQRASPFGLPEADDRPETPLVTLHFVALVYPQNPHAPRLIAAFSARLTNSESGEGDGLLRLQAELDLIPAIGYEGDAMHWHGSLKAALQEAPAEARYEALKAASDQRGLMPSGLGQRGVGGLFLDSKDEPFRPQFRLLGAIGQAVLPAYLPILKHRVRESYGPRERALQLKSHGRLARYLLASGLQGSVEHLAPVEDFLPPLAAWPHEDSRAKDSESRRLEEIFLAPRSWA